MKREELLRRKREAGRRYYTENREKIKAGSRVAYHKHRARHLGYMHKHDEKIKNLWHGNSLLRYYHPQVMGEIGEVIGMAWLKKLGFQDLHKLTDIASHFPFDIVGTYQDSRVLVDVTTDIGKSKLARRYKLAQALGLRFFVLHVSLDGAKSKFIEIHSNQNVTRVEVKGHL